MTLFHLRNLTLSFKGTLVFENVSSFLSEGARVGIVGSNGSGKSCLVKVIMGEISPDSGAVDWTRSLRTGYVPQVFEESMDLRTPLDLLGPPNARMLGLFGIGKNLRNLPCGSLSGGEKRRVSLPTNHLDIRGIEHLEGMLERYRGSTLIVSHDRYFLDTVCDEIWLLEGHTLKTYPGSYSSYVDIRKAEHTFLLREQARHRDRASQLREQIRARRQWFEKAHKDAGQNDFLRRKAKKHASQSKPRNGN